MFDFNEDIEQFITFLDSVQSEGGGDVAEDITGAIKYIHEHFSFNPEALLSTFLITDAPTHGK